LQKQRIIKERKLYRIYGLIYFVLSTHADEPELILKTKKEKQTIANKNKKEHYRKKQTKNKKRI